MRSIKLILIFIVSHSALIAAAQTDSDTLRVIHYNNYPPLEYTSENGLSIGFDIEIFEAIAKAADLIYTIEGVTWDTLLSNVRTKQFDVLTGMYYSHTRDTYLDFTVPILTNSYALFARKDSQIENLHDHFHKEVIIVGGGLSRQMVDNIYSVKEVILVASVEEALQLLSSGSHDGAVLPILHANYIIKNHNYDNIIPVGPKLLSRNLCIAVAEKDTLLLNDIASGFRKIMTDGSYRKIYDKWIEPYEEELIPWRVVKIYSVGILLILIVLGGVIIIWTIMLRRSVATRTKELREEIKVRTLVEEQILQSKILLESSIESPQDMLILSLDLEYRYLYFNTSHANSMKLAYGTKPMIGDCIFDHMTSKDDIDKVKSHYDIALTGEGHVAIDEYGETPDSLFYEVQYNPIYDKQREIIGITSFAQNITSRRQAENQISRQTALLEAINEVFKAAMTGVSEEKLGKTSLSIAEKLTRSKFGFIGEINHDGLFDTIAISNPGWDACDLAVSDAKKATKNMSVRGIDRSTLRDGISRIVNEEEFDTHPDRVGTPEGHPKLTAFLGVPLKHQDKTIGMIGLGNKEGGYEIDDQEAMENLSIAIVEAFRRKRAESALANSEAKFRTLFEESRDPLYITTVDGLFIENNEVWCDLFGYSKEEFKLINAANLFSTDSDRRLFQTAIEKTGHVMDLEVRYRKKDGSEMICLETATVIRDDAGNIIGYRGAIRDMTERIEKQKQFEEALEKAQLGERVKSRFMANMSHEIRTPLNSMLGFMELLNKNLKDKTSEDEKKYFKYMRDSSTRLIRTVDGLLNISQLEADRIQPNPQTISLPHMVKNVFEEFKLRAHEKHLEYELLVKTEKGTVSVDEYCLYQALTNIFDNAIKYTESGGVRIIINRRYGCNQVIIADTGIGISKAFQDNLFRPFSQESEGYNRAYEGAGLGLAITKHYLDLNNIKIELESKKGEGTTITLIFPKGKGNG
ncbi:MAG: transporter substrate-binding domain-containing protein [Candidatus Marinimicrobia bacterium]|nr:transporter substrate-binding domain-containing protein [Candidatus Neomarinimicrobiota bacterium]